MSAKGGSGGEGAMNPSSATAEQVEDLMNQLLEFNPTIPDEVTRHYLELSGFHSDDQRLVRLISLATQKFVEDVCQDCVQLCKSHQSTGVSGASGSGGSGSGGAKGDKKGGPKDKRLVLTNEVLGKVLSEYGVSLRKADFYADFPAASAPDQPPK